MPRVHVVLDEEQLSQIDSVRGDVPRSAWIRRRLEEALGSGLSQHARPASPRAAKDPEAYLLPKIAPRKP